MLKKILAVLATIALTAGLSVVAVVMPASATAGYPTGSSANQPENWQLLDGETCIKVEPVTVVPYVLPDPPAGRVYSKIVVKAGSDQSTSNPNYVVENPTPGQGYKHPEKDTISHIILCTVPIPFSWDWQYAAPTCEALTVTYPANIPSGQANDVNVRIKYGANYGTELTLNFHNNSGTWSGTQAFTYSTHPNWPANIGPYKVVWTQVGGTNYHWEGEVACNQLPADASASVTIIPPTCSAAAQLVLNTPTFATWGAVSGAYSVTATAVSGHTFPGGALTQTFTGTLAPKLSSTDPSCAPPPVCIPRSAVSYTYDPATNSGVITVADVPNSTGQLCQGFWVTATSWRYTTSGIWPQVLDVVQKLPKITTPGVYPYVATVTCGQGDIYASFNGEVNPTPTLSGPSGWETFLHNMGFTGPKPTYVQQTPGCNYAPVTAPTATYITQCGTYGSVTVPADTEKIDYTLTGNGQTGVNIVTAVAKSPYVLQNYPADGWTFNLGTFTDCTVNLNLTYIQECAPDSDNTWRVYNPSSNPITVNYAAYGGGPSGTHTATPGFSYFTTPRPPTSQTMVITWGSTGSGIAPGSKTKAAGTDLPITDPACLKLATPVAPTLTTTEGCGTYGTVTPAVTTGVDYAVVFDQQTGDYTVTATPKPGFYFADNKTKVEFTGNVGAFVECLVNPTVDYDLGVCYATGEAPDWYSSKTVSITLDNSGSEVPVTFHVVGAPDINGVDPSADIVRTLAPGASVVVETTPVGTSGISYIVEFTADGYTIPNGEIVIPAFEGCLEGKLADPSFTNQQCVEGVVVGGSITVELIEGFTYTITGPNGFVWVSGTEPTVTGLEPGTYEVTVEAAPGYILAGPDSWPYEVAIDEPVNCALIPIPVIVPQQITCDADGSFTLPVIEGVTWFVDSVETSGTVTVTTAKTYTLTATLSAGTYWDGTPPNPWELVFAAPTDCVTFDADASIDTVDASCIAPGAINPLKTWVTNASWTTPMPTTPGSHQMTAQANSGHAFPGGDLTKVFTVMIQDQLPSDSPLCDLPTEGLATPSYTVTQPTCSAPGSYTVGGAINAEFVEWRVQGSSTVIPHNTPITALAGSTVTLVATSTDPIEHGLVDLDSNPWVNPIVLTFAIVGVCDTQLKTLALTGLDSGLGLTLAGGLVFLGIGGLLMYARRRQLSDN